MIVAAFLAAMLPTAAAPRASLARPVTAIVHIVLDVPQPGRHLASYERSLRRLGPIRDRFGLGTWTVGTNGSDVAFEPVDHVVVATREGLAQRLLPPILERICRELHQDEVLAELLGPGSDGLGTRAQEFEIVLPFDAAAARLEQVHTIFGDHGRSGASQWSSADGIHIASSVALPAVGRIERALRAAGLHPTSRPDAVLVATRATCARSRAAVHASSPRSASGRRGRA
ncbi:MAG: hypothetical protein ABSD03_13185 [Vulcanimicrobiaceae bacterium]